MKNNFVKRIQLLCLLIFVSGILTAQNIKRIYKSYKLQDNQLVVNTHDGKYMIQYYNKNIVETSFIPLGEKFDKSSHAVVLKPCGCEVKLTENNTDILYRLSGFSVKITKSPFKISYSFNNKYLLSEKNGYVRTDSTENIDFAIDKNEVLFGGGARVLGMNRRGNRLKLYNRAHYGYGTHSELMNYSMPVVISSKIYAVNFDNAPIGYLDLDSRHNNTLRYETIGGRKTYQVIAGESWSDFMSQFTSLTGRQPLLPRWALGNFSSRFGYHSQKQTRATVAQFRKDSIPLDAIILDLFWFGKQMKGNMGNLAFQRDSFPNPEKMMRELDQNGVKTILITEPFILTTSKRWDEAVKNEVLGTDSLGNPFTYDFYFGNTGLVDVFKPKAANWFWNIYKDLVNEGAGGWWGDLGEPEVHPSALQHVNGSADMVHNIYGHNWAKLVYQGYKKDFPQQRPFILMRAGAVGSQRYGMVPWSGDVSRSWDGLKPQTEISLQMGMQGIAWMHSDLGGFAGANLDDELYTRWLQYGVFQPVFRPHAQEDVPSEPIFREPKTKALAKKSIQLRYKMLPYNYTLAFKNHQTGMPLMRPLFFEESNNAELLNISDTYMWGDAFLVSTVTDPGITQKQVYMPKDNVWFDFVNDSQYEGGKAYSIALKEDHIPVFVRSGSFIPMIKSIQTTKDYSLKNIELHYYHHKSTTKSEGELYDDDGKTPQAFEKGAYELLKFNSSFAGRKLKITITTQDGKAFKPYNKSVELCVHNISNKPKKVFVDRHKVAFNWDVVTKTLTILGDIQSEKNKLFTIKLSK